MFTRTALATSLLALSLTGCFDFDGALGDCVDAGICGDEAAPTFTTEPALSDAYSGEAYSLTLAVADGTREKTFAVTSGALPAGLALSTDGVLSGTPTATGDATFTITATDHIQRTVARAFTLRVYSPPAISTAAVADAYTTQSYSAPLTLTGGKTPFTYAITAGELPAGLSINASGALGGTAAATGQASFTVTATDANGHTAERALTLGVYALPALPVRTLADAYVGNAYADTVAASGGKAPLSYALTTGSAPDGVSFSAAGAFSGSATGTGNTSFTVTVSDANGRSHSQGYMVSAYAVPEITTTALSDGYVNVGYSAAIGGAGGKAPVSYSVSVGSLTGGLSLSAGGAITGTPTSAGTRTFTIRALDANNVSSTVQLSLSTYLLPSLPTKTLADGYVGSAFTDSISALNGKTPYTYEVTAGTLPAGVTFADTGAFSGAPTAAAAQSTITVTATDANGRTASRDYGIAAYVEPVITTTSPLADLYTDAALSNVTVNATGGKTPLVFTLAAGALPPGVTLAPGGALSGTVTAAGSYSFTIRTTDANSHAVTQALSVTAYDPPTVTSPDALPDGIKNTPYSETLTVSGGKAPYTWTRTGTLPTGINMTGPVISGTPTVVTASGFTVRVTDANGRFENKAVTLAVYDGMTITTGATLPAAYTDVEHSQQLNVTGGKPSHDWALTSGSTLPADLTLSSSGLISGTPIAPVVGHVFGVTVTDANSNVATKTFSLTVQPRPNITTTTLADAYVGNVYLATVNVTGGKTPYLFDKASGSYPSGITASGNDLGGTPGVAGVSSFEFRVTDNNGLQDTQALTITTYAVPDITTATINDGYVGAPFSQPLNVSGGKSAFTWTLASGTLPPGLNVTSGGVLSGTPTAAGSFTFSVKATDANGKEATRGLTQTIQQPLALAATFEDGYVGRAYAPVTLSATGGRAPYGFALASGSSLPAGLSLASGIISGTPTAATAGATFTLVVTDANGVVASQAFTVAVYVPPSVTTTTLDDAYSGTAYSAPLAGANGKGSHSWALAGGALPTGIGLSSGGVLSGTTTQAGTHNFTVELSDDNGVTATRALTLVVRSPLAVTTTTLAEAYATVPYLANLSASGGATPYAFSLVGGSLNGTLAIASDGTLSGTPATAGTYSFTVQVRDANLVTATAALELVVLDRPSITTTTLIDGYVSSPYGAALASTGGNGSYSYARTAGALPGGVSLSSAGVFSGTPTAAGTFSFTVTVTDGHGQTGSAALQIEVHPRLEITTASLADAYLTVDYLAALSAAGGPAGGYSWSATGLPSGLSLSSSTGEITGIATATGSSTVSVTVTDGNLQTASRSLTLTVYAMPRLVTSCPLPDGYVGSSYSPSFSAADGKPPYSFRSLGGLPSGLTLATDGTFSGSITGVAGVTYPLSIEVADSNSVTGILDCDLTVRGTLLVDSTTLPDLYTDTSVVVTFGALGGRPAFTWSQPAGSVPPAGMSFSAAGVLGGTSTTAGTHAFTIRVTDANSVTASRALTAQTYAPPAIVTSATLPNAFVGAAYSQTLNVTGGKAALGWSATGLPTWLSLNPVTGVLSGTPSAADLGGPFGFDVQVTDANGRTATKTLSLEVRSGFFITTSSLADAYATVPFSRNLDATGGTPSYTWSAVSGFPAWLSLTAGGVLSGTPPAPGTFTITVRANDSASGQDDATLDLVVYARPSVVALTLADAYVTETYGQPLSVTGGKSPFNWSVPGLPAGLTVTPSTGAISGVPTTAGTSNFTATVTDANGETSSRSLTIATYTLPSHVTPPEPPAAYRSVPYSFTQQATGGKGPLLWFVDGSLPSGLSLAAGSSVISGTPLAGATSATFNARVRDQNGREATRSNRSIAVFNKPQNTTPAFASGNVGVGYSQTLSATEGVGPYAFSVPAGQLPAGLSVITTGGTSFIAGTPSASGTFTFSLTVTDANGQTDTDSYSVIINAPLNITTTALAAAYVGDTSYPGRVDAVGGRTPYLFSIQSGSLPSGMSLTSGGTFTGGTPTAGTFTFVVQVVDGNSTVDTQELTLSVLNLPAIAGTFNPKTYVGEPYSVAHTVTGGAGPYSWSVTSGALPAGITLSSANGLLSGTATTAGPSNFSVTVTDGNGRSATRAYSLLVVTPLVLSGATLPDGYVGGTYSTSVSASGGEGPYSYSVTSGSLPPGLILRSNGLIDPSVGTTAVHDQIYSFSIAVQDGNGRVAAGAFTLHVYKNVVVTNGALATALEGIQYRLDGSGAREQIRTQFGKLPLTFSATGLPGGLSVNTTTGELVGIPGLNTQGSYTVNLIATDANSRSGNRNAVLQVIRPGPISGGGTASAAPGSSEITDTLTVYLVDSATGAAITDAAVRLRKNGAEFAPVREAVVGSDGRVVFTGLGLNGTTDTVDVTANGSTWVNVTLAGINAALVTLPMTKHPIPGRRTAAANAMVGSSGDWYVFGGYAGRAAPSRGDLSPDTTTACGSDMLQMHTTTASTMTWSEHVVSSLTTSPGRRRYSAMVALASGNLLMFGGQECENSYSATNDTWMFNPTTKVWTQLNPTNSPPGRWNHKLARTPDGKVWMYGGRDNNYSYPNDIWFYDPSLNRWTQRFFTAPAPATRDEHGFTADGSGKLFTCGGFAPNTGTVLSDCWSYNPATNLWTAASALPQPRLFHELVSSGGDLWIFGGRSNTNPARNDLIKLTGGTGTWTTITPDGASGSPAARFRPMVAYEPVFNRLVLYGGEIQTTTNAILGDDYWFYPTGGGSWTRASPVPTGTGPAGVKVSGTIVGGALSTSSYATVSVSTSSGQSRELQLTLSSGSASFEVNGLPAGDRVRVTVLNQDYSRPSPYLANFLSSDLGVISSDTTVTLPFPGTPPPLLSATGSLQFAPGYEKETNLDGTDVFSALLGLPPFAHRSGSIGYDGYSQTFRLDYFQPAGLETTARVGTSGYTPKACLDVQLNRRNLASGPQGTVNLPAQPGDMSPGRNECSPTGVGLLGWGQLGAPDYTYDLRIADFDNDGRNDLAVVGEKSESVHIQINNGPGQFYWNNEIYVASGAYLANLEVADLDDDGKQDIVVADRSGTGAVYVLYGFGDGFFDSPQEIFSAGEGLEDVAVIDIDDDGDLDVVTNTYSSSPSILYLIPNDRNRSWGSESAGLFTEGVRSMKVADFNQDGLPDLAAVSSTTSELYFYFGTGSGAFIGPDSYSTYSEPVSLDVGDFNSDGVADVVTSSHSGGGIRVFINKNNGGGFTDGADIPLPDRAWGIVAGDFTGDTLDDLVFAGPDYLTLLRNDGNGNAFTQISSIPTSKDLRTVVKGDLNGDDLLDVAVAGNMNEVSWALGMRPAPLAPATLPLSFTAPANTRLLKVDRGAAGAALDWTLMRRVSSSSVSVSFPQISTLRPGRGSPSGQKVSWTAKMILNSGPMDLNNIKFRTLSPDMILSPGPLTFVRQ